MPSELDPASKKGKAGSDLPGLRRRIRHVLWKDGGIIRNRPGLSRALNEVKAIQEDALELAPGDSPVSARRVLEWQNSIRTAGIILDGALRREESRGAHFREGFPEQDDQNWLGHLQVRLSAKGEPVWNFSAL